MASSVSTLNNYSGIPLFHFGNKELLRLGMASMQGQVNENREKLTSLTEQLALDIEVARPIDKQYFQERLQKTVDIVNQFSAGDVSNPSLMNQLTSKLKESIDERVYNGVSSASLRNKGELPQWQEARKKADGSYSDVNFAYASQAWNDYMNSTDPNAVYTGGGGFISYSDNPKKLMDKGFQESLKNLGINAKYVQREDGGYYFDYVNTYEGTMDKARLKQAVLAQIGEDGVRQMDINAWAKYGDVSNPIIVDNLRTNYNSLYDNVNKSLSQEKEILEGELKKIPEGREKQETQLRIQELKEILENNKNKNFDNEVIGLDGYVDPNKYKSVYTSFNRDVEFENLTSLNYQPPRITETKVEDVKLNVRKYEESVRHSLEMEQQGREGLVLRAEQLRLNTLKAEQEGLLANPNGVSGGVINQGDILLGASEKIGEEERGEYNQQTREREFQVEAVKGVNNLVGGIMGKGDTGKLVQDLTNVDIGTLQEIEIAGTKIAINDQNRAQVYAALDNFKKTMVDGSSSVRQTRQQFGSVIQNTTNDLIAHYRASPQEQRDLEFTKDNFYFEKTSNGNYIYKKGLMPGAKTSNYKLLMYKASKGLKLTPEQEMTLKTYTTNAVVSDKGVNLTEWERQQVYSTLQDEIVTTLGKGGVKAVNTMPTYEKIVPSKVFVPSTPVPTGAVSLAGTDASLDEIDFSNIPGTEQDRFISGVNWTDGWGNLSKQLNTRINATKKIVNTSLENKSAELSYTPINVKEGSNTAKLIATKFAVDVKGTPQLYPEVKGGKVTGNWTLWSDVTTGTGKDKKTEKQQVLAKGTTTPLVFNSRDLGINAFDYYNSPYNTILGKRAGSIELGSSGYTNYPKGDSRNAKPSTLLTSNIQEVQRQISNNPQALQQLNTLVSRFNDGSIKFYVKPINGSENYHYVMRDTEGNEISIGDTGKKILSVSGDIPEIYGNSAKVKEELFSRYLQNLFTIE